jgi:hypothetical protein
VLASVTDKKWQVHSVYQAIFWSFTAFKIRISAYFLKEYFHSFFFQTANMGSILEKIGPE